MANQGHKLLRFTFVLLTSVTWRPGHTFATLSRPTWVRGCMWWQGVGGGELQDWKAFGVVRNQWYLMTCISICKSDKFSFGAFP